MQYLNKSQIPLCERGEGEAKVIAMWLVFEKGNVDVKRYNLLEEASSSTVLVADHFVASVTSTSATIFWRS